LQLNWTLESKHGIMIDLATLHDKVDALLDERMSFDEFDRTFGLAYYELPVDVMRSAPAAFVSAVVEKREYVTTEPTAAERVEGWMDPDAFLGWLRAARRDQRHSLLSNHR
jgi:hypothetical protein